MSDPEFPHPSRFVGQSRRCELRQPLCYRHSGKNKSWSGVSASTSVFRYRHPDGAFATSTFTTSYIPSSIKKFHFPSRMPWIASSTGKLHRRLSATGSPRLRSSATNRDASGGGVPGILGPPTLRIRSYGFNRSSLVMQSICSRADTAG
jgi:hypothetical protein